jgi:hypothetical protein
MSTSPHRGRNRSASGVANDEQGEVSRRAMLAGAVATTAVAAVGASEIPAYARTADPNSHPDMMAFLVLSQALTGIQLLSLAPEFDKKDKPDILDADPGVDPFNIKNDYFAWINACAAPAFEKLLQIAKDHPKSTTDIITAVNASDDTKFLARSIVLLWYLGSWYKPEDLQKNSAPGARALIGSQVVSAKAYTLGLVWQIAQAHPMGYSNLQFGYWSREPVDPNDSKSPLGFITATIP